MGSIPMSNEHATRIPAAATAGALDMKGGHR
jgi:hypothetical protein